MVSLGNYVFLLCLLVLVWHWRTSPWHLFGNCHQNEFHWFILLVVKKNKNSLVQIYHFPSLYHCAEMLEALQKLWVCHVIVGPFSLNELLSQVLLWKWFLGISSTWNYLSKVLLSSLKFSADKQRIGEDNV